MPLTIGTTKYQWRYALPAAAVALSPVSGLFVPQLITEASLNKIDEFLTPGLFVDLCAVALGGAAFFYFLADRVRDGVKTDNTDAGSRARNTATQLELATQNLILAFVFSVAGIVATFGLDELFQATFSLNEDYKLSFVGLMEMTRGNVPATIDILASSMTFLVVLIQLAVAGFRLLATLLPRETK